MATRSMPEAPLGAETGSNRFGPLFTAQLDGEGSKPFLIQKFFKQWISHGPQREAVREALQALVAGLPPGALEVAGDISEEVPPEDCWVGWEKVRGISMKDVLRNEHLPHKADERRASLHVILERCASALDALQPALRQPVSLSLDDVFLDFGTADFHPELIPYHQPDKWPRFEVRFVPLCLDSLLESVLPIDSRSRRIAWLKRPTPIRFGGLIYELFGGVCHDEGGPVHSQFRNSASLDHAAQSTLKRCFSQGAESVDSFQTCQGLLKEFNSTTPGSSSQRKQSADEARKRREQQEEQVLGVSGGSIGAITPVKAPLHGKFNKSTGPERATVVTTPKPGAARFLLPASVGGAALVAGTVGYFMLRQPSQPPPLATGEPPPAATPAVPTAAATPPSSEGPTAPPAPPPAPPPDPLVTARDHVASGRKAEAIALLVSESKKSTDDSRKRALLDEAFKLGSVESALELGRLSNPADPQKAAEYFFSGYVLVKNGDAVSQPNAIVLGNDCLKEALTLNHGPALLSAGSAAVASSAARADGIKKLLAALDAFADGNASTKKDPAQERAVIAALSSSEIRTELDRQGWAAVTRGDLAGAMKPFAASFRAGSGDAAAGLSVLVLPEPGQAMQTLSPAVLAELGPGFNAASTPQTLAHQLLLLGEKRNSPDAMVRLADVYTAPASGISTGDPDNNLRRAASLLAIPAVSDARNLHYSFSLHRLAYVLAYGIKFSNGQSAAKDKILSKAYINRAAELGNNLSKVAASRWDAIQEQIELSQ